MAKTKTQYICSECGYTSPKWMGKCPGCGQWNKMTETVTAPSKIPASSSAVREVSFAAHVRQTPKKIGEITINSESRYTTGIGELDRVLGGGIVKGSLILVGGDPGIGKSTLLLQICENAGKDHRIL